ncbi:YidB family protein [Azohydromonas lata]|uniref:YidB family protein n=1 Tax=Azohydromonas lata TaxID=45677 RepID=UPI00082B1D52|nr:YidB family protein [Azohydromonas lata]
MGLLDQILGGLAGVNAGRNAPMGTGMNTPMGGGVGRGGVNPRVLMALLPIVLNLLANRRRGAGGGVGGLGGAGGMGGLGGVLGSVLGGGRSPMGGGLGGAGGLGGLGALAGLGGLAGLLGQLSQQGYGQQAQSWVSAGPNEPLPPEAVSQLFDPQQLSEIAGEAGVSEDEARMGLSELLPEVVDRFTPQGQLPGEDDLRSSIDDFARQLGG